MTRKAFEKIVREVLQAFPPKFKSRLKNIDIVIQEGTGQEEVLGLYEGIPLKDRSCQDSLVMPDKITLFKQAIESECRRHRMDIRREIRQTLYHEIAHHFGISDERLEDLDLY